MSCTEYCLGSVRLWNNCSDTRKEIVRIELRLYMAVRARADKVDSNEATAKLTRQ